MLNTEMMIPQPKIHRLHQSRILRLYNNEKCLVASFTLILIGTIAIITAYVGYQMLLCGTIASKSSKSSNNSTIIYVGASFVFMMSLFLICIVCWLLMEMNKK